MESTVHSLFPTLVWEARRAKGVLEFLRIGACEAPRITGCRANVNAPGAAHRMHSPQNNFLSGVYYVQVPQGAGTVNFHDPRPQAAVLRPPVTELGAQNTDQGVVRVAETLAQPLWGEE